MWDEAAEFPGIGPAYCRDTCGEPCAACPAPRLLPDNLQPVVAYRRIASQWRYVGYGMGGLCRTGLDYAAVLPVLQALAAEWGDQSATELLAQVQIIEEAMLEADSERKPETA